MPEPKSQANGMQSRLSTVWDPVGLNLSSSVDTLYTVWDNITHYKTEGVHFLGDYELSN